MTDISPSEPDSSAVTAGGAKGAAGVVVLGMHRSGTSAVNGAFRAAGFHVTRDEDMLKANATQPGDHNESMAVLNANDQILRQLGRTWFEPPAEEELAPVLDAGRQLVGMVLKALLADAGAAPLALKDPRINVLLPIWGPLIDQLLHPVLVIRDPIEVAASLTARESTPRPIALASWELCMAAALAHLNGRQVTVVHYRQLMSTPAQAIELVESVTTLLAPRYVEQVRPGSAADELRPSYHRNRATGQEHYHGLTRYQQDLWNFLDSLPTGLHTLDVPAELTFADPDTREVTKSETERTALNLRLQQANAQLGQMAQVMQQAHDTLQATQAQATQNQTIVNQSREDLQRALGDAAEMMRQLEQVAAERDAERARADAAEAESRRLSAELDAARQSSG